MRERSERERRNLLCCKAYGAHAAAKNALERLSSTTYPKWLADAFRDIADRTEPLGAALAEWRREASAP